MKIEIDDKNFIIDGQTTLEPSMAKRQGIERPIRIESFATTPDTNIVQLEVVPTCQGYAGWNVKRNVPPPGPMK